jgi:hypothetical protein
VDVDLRLSELLVHDVLVFKVVLLLKTLVLVSYWHQMSLNDPCNFGMLALTSGWYRLTRWIRPCTLFGRDEDHPRRYYLSIDLMLISDDHLSIVGTVMEWKLLRWSWSIADTIPAIRSVVRPASWTGHSNRRVVPRVIGNTIDFEISEEEDILVILLQNNFKQELIQMLVFALVLIVVDVIRVNLLYRVEWNGRDGSCQVADRMIVILIVPERPGWELDPSADKVFLNAWLELKDFTFKQDLFIRVDDYLMDVVLFMHNRLGLWLLLSALLLGRSLSFRYFFLNDRWWFLNLSLLYRCNLSSSGYIRRLITPHLRLIIICLHLFDITSLLILTFLHAGILHL